MKLATHLPAARVTIDDLIDAIHDLVVRPRNKQEEAFAGRTLSSYQSQRLRRAAEEIDRLIEAGKASHATPTN